MVNERSDDLSSVITDGASLALAPDYSGCSLFTIKKLIRKGVRQLHLIGCPQLGLQAELLIAAGMVSRIETAAIGLGEAGPAPAFQRRYQRGGLKVKESTCPAIHSGLQAAEKGVPFLPVAGVLGSDLIGARPDWKVIDDPFTQKPLLLVPAVKPDFALFHAPLADSYGSVWIGVRRELMLMAHAASKTFVTAEDIQHSDLLKDPSMAAGTIPSLYLTSVTHAPQGAHPSGLFGHYQADRAWLARYLDAARDERHLAKFIGDWIAA